MGKAYPELIEKNKEVVEIIKEEEAAFSLLLQKGVKYFNELIQSGSLKGN